MMGLGRRSSHRCLPGAKGTKRTKCMKRAQGGVVAALLLAGCVALEPRVDDEAQAADLPRPYRAALRTELARAYFEQGVPALAAVEAQAALALDPVNRDAAHLLALLAVQGGDVATAEVWFRRALAAPGAADDPLLHKNYKRFACERTGRQASRPGCPGNPTSGDDSKSDVSWLHLLRAQSIAMDNSAASGANRRHREYGRMGQSRQAGGGLRPHRTRQENSSEESRDE
jgi:tetratricopeptide (TPR) repeat protein